MSGLVLAEGGSSGHVLERLQEQHEVVELVLGQRQAELRHLDVHLDLRQLVVALLRVEAKLQLGVGRDGTEQVHELGGGLFDGADGRVKHEVDDVGPLGLLLGGEKVGLRLPVHCEAVEDEMLLEDL